MLFQLIKRLIDHFIQSRIHRPERAYVISKTRATPIVIFDENSALRLVYSVQSSILILIELIKIKKRVAGLYLSVIIYSKK